MSGVEKVHQSSWIGITNQTEAANTVVDDAKAGGRHSADSIMRQGSAGDEAINEAQCRRSFETDHHI